VPWIVLFFAGLCEIVWAVALKQSNGFTRPIPSAVSVLFMLASVLLLSSAMRSIPVGTAYAVWTGIGAAGVAVLGIVFFREPAAAGRLLCLGLILAGIVGLKLSGTE
jgi:quaternary ammonium compound-resistance protein SugE